MNESLCASTLKYALLWAALLLTLEAATLLFPLSQLAKKGSEKGKYVFLKARNKDIPKVRD